VKQDGNDTGMPCRGILSLYYYSGEGQSLQQCKPHVSLRKALMYLTFISEHDVRSEIEWPIIITKSIRKDNYEKGAKYMINNSNLFSNYVLLDIGNYKDM
jgi:hypothetical protein